MGLDDYNRKRKFDQTPEPFGEKASGTGLLKFVVQMHHASRLHYDFRIEVDGVLKSWAVPKGPSLNSQDQRLAVYVEDHPIAYGSFEGIIPAGNYGAGTVMLWDEGTYIERNSSGREDSEKAVLAGLEKGHITLILQGQKLQGEFALIRLKENDQKSWLLIKKRDAFAGYQDVTKLDQSVKTGRTIQEIAQESPQKGDVWLPTRKKNLDLAPKVRSHRPEASLPQEIQSETKVEKIPRRNKPMIAASSLEPFDQEGWLFELTYDGYRAIAEVEKGSVHLYSKQLLPFENKFPRIVSALRKLPIHAVLDGEISEDVYWVRDILHLNGENLRNLPLIERKKRLEGLDLFNEIIRYCPHEMKKGIEFYDQAIADGKVGILARDIYSPYISGTSKRWLQISGKASEEASRGPRLSHLEKIYWPNENITKGQLVDYYRQIAPILLPYLKDRPESLHRHPNGILAEGFFQKDLVGHHPRWVFTHRIYSESVDKSIDYLLCQNESTLLYMANLGCIELNPWLSRVGSLSRPDAIVIDIDPDEQSFEEVVEIAQSVHQVLDRIGAFHICKTSGATGIHIFIPVQGKYEYEAARGFAEAVCRVVHEQYPRQTSLERSPAKRNGKIYLDCLQNVQGQTVAAVYSVRPRPGAPVSTPLLWEELVPNLRPEQFNLQNTSARLAKVGDLWRPMLEMSVDLEACLLSLREKYPMNR